MKLTYRRYQYDYTCRMKEEEFPDDIRIYSVYSWHSRYQVKDKPGEWTNGYIFKSGEKFEGGILIGDAWYRFEFGIYIDDSDYSVEPIENCTPPKECFIIFEQDDLKAKWSPVNFQMVDRKTGELREIDWDFLHAYYKEIAAIGKIRRFTMHGIETTLVGIKSMNSSDVIEVSIHTFSYGHTYGGYFMTSSGNSFTTEEKYKDLFNKKLEEYYKLFKE